MSRPEPADVIARVIESRLLDVHTAMPGTVESFDAATQTADVRPALTRRVPGPDPEGTDTHEQLPVLPCVPVLYPGSSAFGIRWPLARGDRGLLVFAERDIGRWAQQGQDGDPQVSTPHSLAAAIFIPGDFSRVGAWVGLPADALTLGGPGAEDFRVEVRQDKLVAGGESDAAALASKLDLFVDTFLNAVPVAQDGGAAIQEAVATVLGPGWSSASQRLKVDS